MSDIGGKHLWHMLTSNTRNEATVPLALPEMMPSEQRFSSSKTETGLQNRNCSYYYFCICTLYSLTTLGRAGQRTVALLVI